MIVALAVVLAVLAISLGALGFLAADRTLRRALRLRRVGRFPARLPAGASGVEAAMTARRNHPEQSDFQTTEDE